MKEAEQGLSFPKFLAQCLGDKKVLNRASLVAQWLRIRLSIQGTRVGALVWEDPTCRTRSKKARTLQLLSP